MARRGENGGAQNGASAARKILGGAMKSGSKAKLKRFKREENTVEKRQ
jgi:hypothetical protein